MGGLEEVDPDRTLFDLQYIYTHRQNGKHDPKIMQLQMLLTRCI